MSKFRHEPNADDVLQVAGDIALDAIKTKLKLAGYGPDDYSVVITLENEKRLATCLHLAGEPPEELYMQAAFETQLLHLFATARAIGVEVRVVPMGGGQG